MRVGELRSQYHLVVFHCNRHSRRFVPARDGAVSRFPVPFVASAFPLTAKMVRIFRHAPATGFA